MALWYSALHHSSVIDTYILFYLRTWKVGLHYRRIPGQYRLGILPPGWRDLLGWSRYQDRYFVCVYWHIVDGRRIYASINRIIIGSGNGFSQFGAKPLPQPMLIYCQSNPYEQTLVRFESKYNNFHSRKWIWKYHQRNGGRSVSTSVCSVHMPANGYPITVTS